MEHLFNAVRSTVSAFAKDEKGAQVVEYALIIAVVSIGLALALAGATDNGIQGSFSNLVTRVTKCFKGDVTGCIGA